MQPKREELIVERPTDVGNARQKFLELYAEPVVASSYLRIAVLVLGVACIGLVVALLKTNAAAASQKPLIVRINDVGRAEVVDYANFAYKPQEADNRYFLSQWAQLFYSRNRSRSRRT